MGWEETFVGGGLIAVVRAGALLGVAFGLGMPVFAAAGSADPRIGSWTLVSAESTLDPPNRLIVTPGHDGAVHVVMTGETNLDFTAKGNGHDTAVPGNPAFDQVEMRRIGGKQTEITEKKNGAAVATVTDKLSKDGKELTVTRSSQGGADQVTVWERTGSAKAAGNPVAGEWTEDLGKSRLRQGTVLKFESDGCGGVRFSGGFSYDAHFDGKPYDVKNSRNDTVVLQLVDQHTVEATYRRDEQVTQKDKWVVAEDGQQMTVTTTGTLETGQKVNEKLEFKRQ